MNYYNDLCARIFPENRAGKTVGRLQLGTKKCPAASRRRGTSKNRKPASSGAITTGSSLLMSISRTTHAPLSANCGRDEQVNSQHDSSCLLHEPTVAHHD